MAVCSVVARVLTAPALAAANAAALAVAAAALTALAAAFALAVPTDELAVTAAEAAPAAADAAAVAAAPAIIRYVYIVGRAKFRMPVTVYDMWFDSIHYTAETWLLGISAASHRTVPLAPQAHWRQGRAWLAPALAAPWWAAP